MYSEALLRYSILPLYVFCIGVYDGICVYTISTQHDREDFGRSHTNSTLAQLHYLSDVNFARIALYSCRSRSRASCTLYNSSVRQSDIDVRLKLIAVLLSRCSPCVRATARAFVPSQAKATVVYFIIRELLCRFTLHLHSVVDLPTKKSAV